MTIEIMTGKVKATEIVSMGVVAGSTGLRLSSATCHHLLDCLFVHSLDDREKAANGH
jgi:hypothetical protein